MASITQISTATDFSATSGTKVGTGTTTSTSSGSSAASDNATKLKNQFLTILLTQMQHQNPLDPMDTKEFTGQLTQFSSLEQQIDTNSKLDGLLSTLSKNNLTSAFNYIGQYVDLDTETTAVQNGAANWSYSLPKEAKSVAVKVTDSSGVAVYNSTLQNTNGGNITAGTYALGLTSADLPASVTNGAPLKLTITALGADGKAITTDIHTTVKVDSVQSTDKGIYLQAGGIVFEMTDVKKIVPAPTQPTTTPATTA